MIPFQFPGSLFAVAWWLGGCWHIYLLARFFQLEGYDTRRFLRWYARSPTQRRTALKDGLVVLVYALIFALLAWPGLPLGDGIRELLSWISGLVALLAVIFRPAQREVKQVFTRTQRAVRIVLTAWVAFGLLFIGVLHWRFLLFNYPSRALTITLVGFICLLLAPLMLPLANLIMYPVEATLRRGYLRRARHALKAANPTVIAITGSYGKTTTKEYIAHLLEGRYRVLKTPKSYNTLMGVCRVINEILPKDHSYDYFIVEMGAYIPGEIAAICKLTEPHISLVTAVGPMHLERFGSIENTAKAKYEIIEALPSDGVAIFNDDDPHIQAMHARGYPATRCGVTRQSTAGARFSAQHIRMTAEGMDFDVRDAETGEERVMHAPVYGDHNVSNILMAVAVARHVGLSLAEVSLRVATLQPAEHRLVRRLLPNGVVTIDDAYSANPIGTREALKVLALHKSAANRLVVITSGMVELGPIQDAENTTLGAAIAEVATDVVLINPAQTRPMRLGLERAHFPSDHIYVVTTTTEAIGWMQTTVQAGDAVLIMSDLPDTY